MRIQGDRLRRSIRLRTIPSVFARFDHAFDAVHDTEIRVFGGEILAGYRKRVSRTRTAVNVPD